MNKKTLFLKHNYYMCLLTILCTVLSLHAQETDSQASFDYESELNRSVSIPNSPEAEAFTQYGNTPVNMYAGSPEIGIPIYTHQGRELSLPVNLNYDASGIKVEQLATASGLGWNLAVGGRISRIANGLPDDYITAGSTPYLSFWNDDVRDKMLVYRNQSAFFADEQDVVDYFDFMNSISINEFETQPDYFSLNAIGINDYIAFDVNTRQAYALNNPHIIVEFDTSLPNATDGMRSITKWTITGADGTKYYFEAAEITDYDGNDIRIFDVYKTYNSSWVLTKVESANRRDTYTFNYTPLDPWSQNFSVSGYSSYSYTIDENTPINVPSPPYVTSFIPTIRIEQQRLDNIVHNGKEIVSISYQNRYDIGASDAIDAITIKNGSTQDYKIYDFLTSYFGISSGQNPASEIPSHIRLKLDGIDIKSSNNDLYQKYRFDYFSPEQVPPVVSKGQDYMGYYNGQGSNTVLFPEVTVGQHTFGGANRSVNFTQAIKGTLSRIYYPTGGYTDFEFEPHTTPAEPSDVDENTFTQIYASQLLIGAMNTDAPCGTPASLCECGSGWCNDEYGPGRSPNFTNTSFDIQEAGNYTLKYLETDTNSGSPSEGVARAYAFKVSNATSCGPAPILDTDQILDPGGDGGLLIDNTDVIFNKYDHQYLLNVDGEMGVFLTPGCYQILLINPSDNTTQLLQVSRLETTIDSPAELADVQRAGFRIKTIKNYTDTNELATEKEYLYKVEKISTADSSGNIIFNPQFYTVNNGLTVTGIDDGCQIVDATSLFVSGSSSGGSQPHVAYSRVYEVFKKGTTPEDNGGYIQHDFYIDQNTGLHSPGVPPNVSSYRPHLAVGQEINTKTFDNTDTVLQEVSRDLATNSSAYKYFGSFGLYVINKPEKAFDLLVSKPYLSGVTYDFAQKIYGAFSTGEGDGSTACAYVYPDVTLLGWDLHITSYVPSFELRSSSVEGAVGGVVQQVSTQYFGDLSDNKQLQTTEDYEYDNTIGHLLREKTSTLETDEQITQEYRYALELTDPVFLQMQSRNQLQMPVEVTTTSETAVNTRKSNYSAIGNGFYPTSIEIANNLMDPATGAISNHPNEERIFFEYYTNGNIKTSYQAEIITGGFPSSITKVNETAYIWGYDNKYPIAKIVNASHSEIASYVASLVSLAQADNDRTLDYIGNEGALRQALDAMREDPSLSHTHITTYTYDPLIGITSMTDPRGYTMYYEYDSLYRLNYVKDSDGNILNENEYNYRINN